MATSNPHRKAIDDLVGLMSPHLPRNQQIRLRLLLRAELRRVERRTLEVAATACDDEIQNWPPFDSGRAALRQLASLLRDPKFLEVRRVVEKAREIFATAREARKRRA